MGGIRWHRGAAGGAGSWPAAAIRPHLSSGRGTGRSAGPQLANRSPARAGSAAASGRSGRIPPSGRPVRPTRHPRVPGGPRLASRRPLRRPGVARQPQPLSPRQRRPGPSRPVPPPPRPRPRLGRPAPGPARTPAAAPRPGPAFAAARPGRPTPRPGPRRPTRRMARSSACSAAASARSARSRACSAAYLARSAASWTRKAAVRASMSAALRPVAAASRANCSSGDSCSRADIGLPQMRRGRPGGARVAWPSCPPARRRAPGHGRAAGHTVRFAGLRHPFAGGGLRGLVPCHDHFFPARLPASARQDL